MIVRQQEFTKRRLERVIGLKKELAGDLRQELITRALSSENFVGTILVLLDQIDNPEGRRWLGLALFGSLYEDVPKEGE